MIKDNKMLDKVTHGRNPFNTINKEAEGDRNNKNLGQHQGVDNLEEEAEEEVIKITTEIDNGQVKISQIMEIQEKSNQKDRINDLSKIPVGGRLFSFRATWRGAAHESIISKGLSWQWEKKPPPPQEIQQRTSTKMTEKVRKLHKLKVIEKVKNIKWQSRLFMVPKKDSEEERLIVDLSELNKFVKCPKFKMLTMNQIRLLLPKTFWTVSLDLENGYWHVPITPKKRPYLGFRYKNQNWQFRGMPFGLNIGPRIFTKIIAHVIKVMATKGIWCLPFLDDLLIIASTEEECRQHTEEAMEILKSLGWILNQKKSRKVPSQIFEWLGAKFNLVEHTVQATQEKAEALKRQLRSLIKSKYCSKREIMKIQGLANWIGQFDPVTRALISRTKVILRKFKRGHLDAQIMLNRGLKLGLVRWLSTTTIPQTLGKPAPSIVIQTDASLEGWGFRINQSPFKGEFDQMEEYSINTLELLTVWFALLMVEEKGIAIQILCDNSTAISAVRRGTSPIFHLSMISELIWRRTVAYKWTMSISHIEGKFNVLADQLSRNTTISTEWSLPPRDFRRIILKMNPHLQVDLFATSLNHHLKTFISPCPDEKAIGIDAMKINWERWEHLYLFPPTKMISKVLAKLKETQFKSAILITPDTPIQPWFMALKLQKIESTSLKVHLQQIVVDRLEKAPNWTKLRVWIL